MNLDLLSFTVTAPGASPGTAMTAIESATIRNARAGAAVAILAGWTFAQGAGSTGVVWRSINETSRGYRYTTIAAQPMPGIPALPAYCQPQDPITITQIGSAVAADIETASLLCFYEDLPGCNGQLINTAALYKHGVNAITVQGSITNGTGAGFTGTSQTLATASDLLEANANYALVGITVGAACAAITLRGVDTGGLRIGVPGWLQNHDFTANFFRHMSERHDLPCIPVFNSANRVGTILEVLGNENAVATPYTLHLVLLDGDVKGAKTGSNPQPS